MSNLPQLSFVMCTRNGDKFIGEAVKSVIAQTFTDWELIVVNDHSSDNDQTETIIKAFNDQRIRYYTLKDRFGRNTAAAHNFGNAMARSEIIAVCDSDDTIKPERAALTIAAFNEGCDVFYARYDILDQETGIISQRSVKKPIIPFDLAKLAEYNYIPHGSSAYKRSDALLFPYNSFLTLSFDYDFFTRLAKANRRFHYCPEIIYTYRIHGSNMSDGRSNPRYGQFIMESRGWDKFNPKTAEAIINPPVQ